MRVISPNGYQALKYYEEHKDISYTQIALLYGIDRHTLSHFIKNGIMTSNCITSKRDNDMNYYIFSNEELELVEKYVSLQPINYHSFKKIYKNAPELGTIRRWCDILGKQYITGIIKKYNYNNRFEIIETEEDAYWLGFITADGCLLKNRPCLQIKLAKQDENHLIKFCYYLGLNDELTTSLIKHEYGGAYTRDNETSGIVIYDKNIYNNLLNKGITPRKSGKEKYYKCANYELQRAYFRGLIDGDGCLLKNGKGISLVGSYEICSSFKKFVQDNICDIVSGVHPKDTIFTIEPRGEKAKKIINELYNNANIYLDRKYKIYEELYKI